MIGADILKYFALFFWFCVANSVSAAEHRYDHNGSEMIVRTTNDLVEIRYAVPRDGLAAAGVRQGTLLFEGVNNAGYVDGMANLFSSTCGRIDYYVHGDFEMGESFTLTGAAPVRDKSTCEIKGNIYDGPASKLIFTSLRTGDSPRNDGCIATGQSAELRSGPGPNYGSLQTISGCGIDVRQNACRDAWCPVSQGRAIGWMDTSILN